MTDRDDFNLPKPEPAESLRRHAVPQGPPPAQKPTKVSKEDRLEVEVLSMKLQNVQLQMQIMQSDLAKALATRDQLVEKFKEKREYFLQTYGVDITAINIDDEGNIIRIQPNPTLQNIPGL